MLHKINKEMVKIIQSKLEYYSLIKILAKQTANGNIS